jgi:hypothetical protein
MEQDVNEIEAEFLRWVAQTPGAKDFIGNEDRREFALIMWRMARGIGWSGGYAACREMDNEAQKKLDLLKEILQ